MQTAFKSQQPPRIAPKFVNDEVTCPLCESYHINEGDVRFECLTCGTTWKSIGFK